MFLILVMVDYQWDFFGSYFTREDAEDDLRYWGQKYPKAVFKIVER